MRKHCRMPVQDKDGTLTEGVSVRLINPDDGTTWTGSAYQHDTGTDVWTNPFVPIGGIIDFYLDAATRLNLGLTYPGGEETVVPNVDIGDPGAAPVYKETFPFAVTGALTVKTYANRFYVADNYTVLGIRASVGTAPTGAAILVDVNKNDTSIFAAPADRPSIAAGSNTAQVTPSGLTLAAGDYLTVDVDQIGSTVAGSDLTVQIRVQRTS